MRTSLTDLSPGGLLLNNQVALFQLLLLSLFPQPTVLVAEMSIIIQCLLPVVGNVTVRAAINSVGVNVRKFCLME